MTNTTYFNGFPFTNVTTNHTETVVVDAYGQLTFPGGSVVDALRIKEMTDTPQVFHHFMNAQFHTRL